MLQLHMAASDKDILLVPRGNREPWQARFVEQGERSHSPISWEKEGRRGSPSAGGMETVVKLLLSANKSLQLLPCGGKCQVGSRPPRRDPGPEHCSHFPAGRSEAQVSALDQNPQGGSVPAYSSVLELEDITGMKM